MFAVKHIWGSLGNEALIEASQVNYYPAGCPSSPHPDAGEAHVQCILPSGDQYIACYGDVFVMQGGKTVHRYPLGTIEDWLKRREPKGAVQVTVVGEGDIIVSTVGNGDNAEVASITAR